MGLAIKSSAFPKRTALTMEDLTKEDYIKMIIGLALVVIGLILK